MTSKPCEGCGKAGELVTDWRGRTVAKPIRRTGENCGECQAKAKEGAAAIELLAALRAKQAGTPALYKPFKLNSTRGTEDPARELELAFDQLVEAFTDPALDQGYEARERAEGHTAAGPSQGYGRSRYVEADDRTFGASRGSTLAARGSDGYYPGGPKPAALPMLRILDDAQLEALRALARSVAFYSRARYEEGFAAGSDALGRFARGDLSPTDFERRRETARLRAGTGEPGL